MRFVVLTRSGRRPLAEKLIADLSRLHPAATVEAMLCDPRLPATPPPGTILPQGLDYDGLRWADLVLGLGWRLAGWAALPWVLEGRHSAEGPTVVLQDTFIVRGSLETLGGYGDKVAARARHVDPDSGAWGGYAPGLVVLPDSPQWAQWWRRRSIEIATTGSDPGPDGPWWQLPISAHTVVDPALCFSARTAGEIALEDSGALRLIDLAGLDPSRPWWFAAPGEEPGAVPSEVPGLRALLHECAGELLSAGWVPDMEHDPEEMVGLPVTEEVRGWYRAMLSRREDDGLPPNPLVAGEVSAFVELLGSQGDADGLGAGHHVDLLLEDRQDLLRAFPHPRWRDRRGMRRWLWSHGLSESAVSMLTLPPPPRSGPAVVTGPRPFGVNLVGYLGAELGLGVAARRWKRAFDVAGIPNAEVGYDRTSSNQRRATAGSAEAPYHFNVMVITPDQLPLFVDDVGAEFLAGHHNIGSWFWESDVVAPQQMAAFDLVDEVWVATEYLLEAFAAPMLVPVSVVPAPLVFDDPGPIGSAERARLGLDDRFTFLFSFDFLSVAERKNPEGLAEAYRRAFPEPDGPTRLVLKSISGHVFPEQREALVDAVADRPDIEVWDRLLTGGDRLALLAAADCYVSLHRAEGLGLTMAEAMAVGTPVIATGYSGNLDFMDDASALLVPAEVVEVGPGHYYPAHGHWADPDLDAAAAMMQRVHADPDLRTRLAAAGRAALEPFSYEAVGNRAADALLRSWRTRR